MQDSDTPVTPVDQAGPNGNCDTPIQRLEASCVIGDRSMFERALNDGANPKANRDRAAWIAREHGHETLYSELVARGCNTSAHV